MKEELQNLFSAQCLMMFIFVPSLAKYLKGFQINFVDMISMVKFSKGHKFRKECRWSYSSCSLHIV